MEVRGRWGKVGDWKEGWREELGENRGERRGSIGGTIKLGKQGGEIEGEGVIWCDRGGGGVQAGNLNEHYEVLSWLNKIEPVYLLVDVRLSNLSKPLPKALVVKPLVTNEAFVRNKSWSVNKQ